MSKLFGYDRKAHDRYVDAQKLARDYAYRDARKIEAAAGLLTQQIPGIHAAAGGMFRAGEQAAAIGRANATNILAETGEWARRRSGEQGAEQSLNRATAAASGIRLDTGGSSDIFQQAVKDEHSKEIAWGWKAGRSQADIATREGLRVQQEAISAGEGILAGIPAVQSQAELFMTDAGALRRNADIAVAEARANRASARSGAYLSAITTAIAAVGTYGAFTGFAGLSGGAATAAKVGAGILGIGAVAGLLSNKDSSPEQIAAAVAPSTATPAIPGITAGKNLDVSQLPDKVSYKAPQLPSGEKASPTTKRQYAAQQAKKGKVELNIFGQAGNPLAAVGA